MMIAIPIGEFADQLVSILPVIMKELVKQQIQGLCKGMITLHQFLVLEFLYNTDACKMRDLADVMNVAMPSMTGVIDRLVRDQYVQRELDPSDRRIIKVALTPKGRKLIGTMLEQRRKTIINIFGRISQSDREDYLRILTKIKDILTREPELAQVK
ncbi:MAG: MarR family transcriptional regulator [Candidatus Omnitrophota bacterium]